MTFHPAQLLVFNHSGAQIGIIDRATTPWTVTAPRTYRLNEIEDFAFSIPRRDLTLGVDILTGAVDALLLRDNLIWVENDIPSMPGWAGVIDNVVYSNDSVVVSCIGTLSLLTKLETDRIKSADTDDAAYIAGRLVAAANAKQATFGDIIVGFAADATKPLYGKFDYEGDILAGLQQLAQDTLCEFYMENTLGGPGLQCTLHWSTKYQIPVAATISDGPGGNLKPGTAITFSGLERLTYIKLRGATTTLSQFVDYPCVSNVLKDLTPEIDWLDPNVPPNVRHREALNYSVSWGFSDLLQKAMAQAVQARYIAYYKTFLYAYHRRKGKPYLAGYDWSGPDGIIDPQLTRRYMRTQSWLGQLGNITIITGANAAGDPNASLTNWTHNQSLAVSGVVGVAANPVNLTQHYVGLSSGMVALLDGTTTTNLFQATVPGEALVSVASDPTEATVLWTMSVQGGQTYVRSWDSASGTMLTSWNYANANASDMVVDVNRGSVFIVSGASAIDERALADGAPLNTISYSGFSSYGISASGGLLYVAANNGSIRGYFPDGGFAFGFANPSPSPVSGIWVDGPNGYVWEVTPTSLEVYNAEIAVGVADVPGSVDGAPGFDQVTAGQFVHIVMVGDHALAGANNKCLIVYTPGHWENVLIPGPIGQPDRLEKQWINGDINNPASGNQVVGFARLTSYIGGGYPSGWISAAAGGQPAGTISVQSNGTVEGQAGSVQQVLQGEEGRLCDWDPKRDGYGSPLGITYITSVGHILRGSGWYPRDWDVPDDVWLLATPPWPEGQAFLADLLTKLNNERSVQAINVTYAYVVWGQLRLGAEIPFSLANQGPTGGLSGTVRVLQFSPDEASGYVTLIGEVLP